MAYTITPTNGQNPIVIADGTINTSTTLTLVGKNYPNYGDILDTNFVRLLENSSNVTAPGSPLTGEIWWDSGNNILKVYTGSEWKNVGSTTSSATAPTNNNEGDLWWDNVNKALYAWDSFAEDFVLVGPIGGLAEVISETLTDGVANYEVISFKLSGVRYLILHTDVAFTPTPVINGFQTIYPGLNLASSAFLTNAKFTGQATDSVTVGGIYPNAFIRSDQNSSTTGTLSILNNNGLNVGSANNFKVNVSSPNVAINNMTSSGVMNFRVRNGSGTEIKAVDIYPNGNLVANFDLVVQGSTYFAGGSGEMYISATTQSTSTTTGALRVAGGVGIVKNLYVGGNGNFAGTLTAGSVTFSSLNATTISATTLTGTISTAYQPNITGLGSLANLTVSGATNLNTLTVSSTANLATLNMSGILTLSGNPSASLHAATKGYVDNAVSTAVGGISIPSVPGVSGSTNQVAYFSSANSVTGSSGLTYSGSALAVSGAITATGDITAFASDIRLKQDIAPIENPMEKLKMLKGFTYKFNEIAASLGMDTTERHLGLSAQDVQAVMPDVVRPAPISHDYLTIKYDKLVALLIEAVKELSTEIENLKAKS